LDQKTTNFFDLLNRRTIEAIENTDIKESCTATLLLLFAAVDSLSKLTCDDKQYTAFLDKTGNRGRFRHFLEDVMGGDYGGLNDALYDLRNDIVHTGINTKVVLTKRPADHHLEEIEGYLWVNSAKFLDDLNETIRRIKQGIEAKDQYYQNAISRLVELNIIEVDQDAEPSPGPDESPFRR
jgi:hypothetical protein